MFYISDAVHASKQPEPGFPSRGRNMSGRWSCSTLEVGAGYVSQEAEQPAKEAEAELLLELQAGWLLDFAIWSICGYLFLLNSHVQYIGSVALVYLVPDDSRAFAGGGVVVVLLALLWSFAVYTTP